MTGLLLPARLLFVTFVSDDWLGSFGVISAISVGILILVKKGKLGEFGNMFQRQIEKLLKGKRKILVYAESVFVLVLLGSMIFAINQGNSTYSDMQDQFFTNQEIDTPERLIQHTNEWEANDWFAGLIAAPVAFVTAFPQMSAVIASIDGTLDGWLLHFYTVGFVEYAEFLGILLLYRFVIKTKPLAGSNPPNKTATFNLAMH
jgi:preprotein translocase subunit SecG